MSKGFLIALGAILALCGVIFISTGRRLTAEDAFSRFIADPIPSSVGKLEGTASSGITGGSAKLAFTIAAADLDRIIQEKAFVRVDKFSLQGRLSTNPAQGSAKAEFYEKTMQGSFYLLEISADHTQGRFEYFRP